MIVYLYIDSIFRYRYLYIDIYIIYLLFIDIYI